MSVHTDPFRFATARLLPFTARRRVNTPSIRDTSCSSLLERASCYLINHFATTKRNTYLVWSNSTCTHIFTDTYVSCSLVFTIECFEIFRSTSASNWLVSLDSWYDDRAEIEKPTYQSPLPSVIVENDHASTLAQIRMTRFAVNLRCLYYLLHRSHQTHYISHARVQHLFYRMQIVKIISRIIL